MGVIGLWRLIEPTGHTVPLETLHGKVLAVDVSIWIHELLQGSHNRTSKPNAHLLGLYRRICKLLYYKIKPVFIFDGGVPWLKKKTIDSRRKLKSAANSKVQKLKADLINNLVKHAAVETRLKTNAENNENDSNEVLSRLQKKAPPSDDMFKLPATLSTSPIEFSDSEYDSDSSVDLSPRKQAKWKGNIHNVDITTAEFESLPADVRYDLLTELKETRKQNSWGRLHEMPKESHEFSAFQLKRLQKRRLVQTSLESAESEMGGKIRTIEELNKLLTEQGIINGDDSAYRIAADSTTRLIYIKDKNAFEKEQKEINVDDATNKNDVEPVAGPSKVSLLEDMNAYELGDESDSDFEVMTVKSTDSLSENEIESFPVETSKSRPPSRTSFDKKIANPALTYMLEYSGLTQNQILTVLEENGEETDKTSAPSQPEDSQTQDSEEPDDVAKDKGALPAASASRVTAQVEEQSIAFDSPVAETRRSTASTSDSDTDDFIEIHDVPVPDVNTNSIQITFNPEEQAEVDTLFADVFEPERKELKTMEASGNKKEGDNAAEKPRNLVLQAESPRQKLLAHADEVTVIEEKSEKNQTQQVYLPDVVEIDDDKDVQAEKSVEEEKLVDEEKATDSENANSEAVSLEDKISAGTSVDSSRRASPLPLEEEDLLSLREELKNSQSQLAADIGKFEKQALTISEQIRTDAQELLRLFGIPYIVAPMEAEAQCAYLEEIHLTDGTITDDSDIWLFGGRTVYRHFFNDRKTVLEFRSTDIQHNFKLTRNEMIQLALLVGSDYTTGLRGIGPVTAVEILAAFPAEGDNILHGLTNFSSWFQTSKVIGSGKVALRNKLRNVQIEKGFPSQAVAQAYLFPTVDESKETFTWGKPNLTLLANYARQKLGWSKAKFDEVMTPVVKKLAEASHQTSLDSYFKIQKSPKSIDPVLMSKRVGMAVKNLTAEFNADAEEPKKKPEKSKSKRKPKTPKEKVNVAETSPKPKTSSDTAKSVEPVNEYIPQRQKNKEDSLKKKLKAIEIFRKSKQGLNKTKKVKRCVRKVKEEAELSENENSS